MPAIVGRDGVTIIVKKGSGAEEVFRYLDDITQKAGLNASYRWDENEIIAEEREGF